MSSGLVRRIIEVAFLVVSSITGMLLAPALVVAIFWGRCATRRRRKRRLRPRVLFTTYPIISVVYLVRALRLYGYEAKSLVFQTYYITDDFDMNLERFHRNPMTSPWLPWIIWMWAVTRFDVFHMFFNGGVLRNTALARWELAVFKLAGKQTVISTYGSDVRTREATLQLGPYNCCMNCPQPGAYCICNDAKGKANVARASRWATALLALGDMIEYVPASRTDIHYWPIDLSRFEPAPPDPAANPVRILHAPNHAFFKGTEFLRSAVERLKSRGVPCELVMVERVPNEQAIKLYRTADIVAEQFIIGSFGYLSLECMALAKPVVCYIRKKDYLLDPDHCPLISVHPGELEDLLERLIRDGEERRRIGEASRQYVEKYYSLQAVGRRLDRFHRELWLGGVEEVYAENSG